MPLLLPLSQMLQFFAFAHSVDEIESSFSHFELAAAFEACF